VVPGVGSLLEARLSREGAAAKRGVCAKHKQNLVTDYVTLHSDHGNQHTTAEARQTRFDLRQQVRLGTRRRAKPGLQCPSLLLVAEACMQLGSLAATAV